MKQTKQPIEVIRSDSLSEEFDDRFVIVDTETGEILDDAQGYGYRTKQKAYAAYRYQNRNRSKDKRRKQEEKAIRQWWQDHRELSDLLEQFAFEIVKGSWGPDDKFDANLLKEVMDEQGIESDFTPGKLLRVWKKMWIKKGAWHG